MNDQQIISEVLVREGWPRYTNLRADRGGPTKGGITLEAWRAYSGKYAMVQDLKAITEQQAREFYQFKYITAPNFDAIADPHLRALTVDAGVHHGPRHAAKWLQWAASDEAHGIRLAQDGMVGDKTIAAVNSADPLELFLWVIAFRYRLFGRLVSQDHQLKEAGAAGFQLQAIFMGGWANRVSEFLEQAAVRLEIAHQQN